jgi:chromosome segregation ATPase
MPDPGSIDLRAIEAHTDALIECLRRVHADNATKATTIDELRREVAECHARSEQATARRTVEIDNLQREIVECRAQLEQANARPTVEIDNLQREIAECHAQLEQANARPTVEIDNLQCQINDLNERLTQTTNQKAVAAATLERERLLWDAQMDVMALENEALQQRLSDAVVWYNHTLWKLDATNIKLRQGSAHKECLRTKLQEVQDTHLHQINRLQTQLHNVTAAREDITQQLERERQNAANEIRRLETALASLTVDPTRFDAAATVVRCDCGGRADAVRVGWEALRRQEATLAGEREAVRVAWDSIRDREGALAERAREAEERARGVKRQRTDDAVYLTLRRPVLGSIDDSPRRAFPSG